MQLSQLSACLDASIPPILKEEWDNSGFLVGCGEDEVTSILLAFDISMPVVEEALSLGANVIVSHHPVIFDPIKSVTDFSDSLVVCALLRHRLNAICIHTPLDCVSGGINDLLAKKCALLCLSPLCENPGLIGAGIGRIGALKSSMPFDRYVSLVKASLNVKSVYCHNAGRAVEKVAVVGGSGDDYLEDALKSGCDTYVTGELRHRSFVWAANHKLNLIAAGHYHTEIFGLQHFEEIIRANFPDSIIHYSVEHAKIITIE